MDIFGVLNLIGGLALFLYGMSAMGEGLVMLSGGRLEQILEKLWDCEGNFIDGSALTVYIRRLRIKVEDNPSQPQMLLTVRGMGYKWNVIC